jgi:cyclophilin family peptidyl-prolyl cis-trans isomerase
LSSDPNRQRPRSSKKRRAVQTGGAGRPPSQRVQPGAARAGRAAPPQGGIPGAWLAIGAVAVFAVGVLLASGTIQLGGGASASPSADLFGSAAPSSRITGGVTVVSPSPGESTTSVGTNCPTSQPPPLPAGETRTVTIATAKGSIVIKVEADLGPQAAGNFVALVSCGFYDGVVFHRVVPNFVIQGGDPDGTGRGGPGYQFADDPVTAPYVRGTVAMANAGANTNGSQFFIVLSDTNSLTPNYSIFGRVTSGMETADAIVAAAAGVELPTNPVAMDKVTISNP